MRHSGLILKFEEDNEFLGDICFLFILVRMCCDVDDEGRKNVNVKIRNVLLLKRQVFSFFLSVIFLDVLATRLFHFSLKKKRISFEEKYIA